MGSNYLSLLVIADSGAKVLIYLMQMIVLFVQIATTRSDYDAPIRYTVDSFYMCGIGLPAGSSKAF